MEEEAPDMCHVLSMYGSTSYRGLPHAAKQHSESCSGTRQTEEKQYRINRMLLLKSKRLQRELSQDLFGSNLTSSLMTGSNPECCTAILRVRKGNISSVGG
ncbi:hypothetical protein D1007_42861 [Hordeum vulgare]|nr:hypothetical protein D1007_42861 [Hordeum vulgare]